MNDIESLVSNVGFPIAIALFFGIVLYRVFFTFFNNIYISVFSKEKLIKLNVDFIDDLAYNEYR